MGRVKASARDDADGVFGPAVLGRGAVVNPGQEAPAPLGRADRVRVDDAVLAQPREVADRLHRSWMARRPYVVELAVDAAALREPERCEQPVWSLPADFLFHRERLGSLVWANTVDLRGATPRWWHGVKAERACDGVAAGGPADVVLPDGTPAWVDGGPRQPLPLPPGYTLLHRESTERGRLRPTPGPGPAPGTGAGAGPGAGRNAGAGLDQAVPGRGAGPLLAGLAPDQLAAVTAATSCARVAAPAGSGKTRVLTARLAHLLGERGVEPDLVLALAYNADAAAQLRARCAAAGVRGARAVTLHAHARAILARHRGMPEVWDEGRCRTVLHAIVRPEPRANADPLAPYLEAMERVRVALVAPEQVERERDDVPDLPRVLAAYRERLRRAGAVDFPEMVLAALELLLTNPDARRAEQATAQHVLVDEFQDLTPAYLLLVRMLASPQLAVFGVGDDDQVLYDYAGATPRYLLDFEQLFPGAADHPLTVNYRCPPAIVALATSLLSRNAQRVRKTVTAAPGRQDPPEPVRLLETTVPRQAQQAGAVVAGWLRTRPVTDIAVLARVNVALLPTQVELALAGIPCHSPVGPALLARTGVRAALAYLRLATAPPSRLDGDDMAEVLYRPFRPLPGDLRTTLRGRRWTLGALEGLGAERLDGRAGTAWTQLLADLRLLQRLGAPAGQVQPGEPQPTAELLRLVRDHVGVDSAAGALDDSAGGEVGSSHVDDLDALTQIALRCPDPRAFPAFLERVLGMTAAPGEPAVRLASVHKVKGLEWPCVLLVGAAEGICPHRLAVGPDGLEAERRVWHVALTRAREHLAVIVPVPGASRFLTEMREPAVPLTTAPSDDRADGRRPSSTGRRSSSRGATGTRDRAKAISDFPAVTGLHLEAPGGTRGAVAILTPSAALIRTGSGALLTVPLGTRVRVDGTPGRLVRPS